MRTTIFDIESSSLNANFGIILCCCFMDWDLDPKKRKVETLRLDQYDLYQKKPWDDTLLARAIRDRLMQSDIIVSYNGRMFDIPFINTRLVMNNDDSMSKMKHLDLYFQVRYKLRLHSSRLASVQEALGLPDAKTPIKPEHWVRALTGHRQSFDYIVKHCVLDVKVLGEAYDQLRHLVEHISK